MSATVAARRIDVVVRVAEGQGVRAVTDSRSRPIEAEAADIAETVAAAITRNRIPDSLI